MSETSVRATLPVGEPVETGPAQRPSRTVLRGRLVHLVPLDPAAHAQALFAETHGADEDRIWCYMGDGPFPDLFSFRASLEAKAASVDPLFFAILDAETARPLGYQTLMRIDAANRVIEVGNIVFGRSLQRTPGATEAQYLFARHVFEDLGYRRYEWKCNDLNAPSKAAARRLGFTHEGVFRHHMIIKGRNRDTAWFSMLAEEWPSRKAGFERWLDPANFDAAGAQRVSLAQARAGELAGLRRATAEDFSGLERLQHGAYAANRTILGVVPIPLQADYRTILETMEVWLADGDGGPAGALIVEPRVDDLLVWSIAVDPSRQGSGLGNRLLAAAEDRARALGHATVRLYTGQKLTRNVGWYSRHGYRVERIEPLADRTVVHMIKTDI
ncbi:GNAT family N-acetyltransferase [Alsobacter sp. R-9]